MSSERQFRLACGRFTTGIAIATVIDSDGEPHGITVNSFTSVSLTPPLISISLDHRARILEHFRPGVHFGINVLNEHQREISDHFASSKRDRFNGIDWTPGGTGVPLLPRGLAFIECALRNRVPAGDHDIVIGEVMDSRVEEGRPLVYYASGYRKLEPFDPSPTPTPAAKDQLQMIKRYTRPEMGSIWSDENKFRQWLEVELAAAEALAELGVVPKDAAAKLRAHAGFDVARIHAIEKEVKHDVIAFTTAVAETMAAAGHAEASRWFHYGLTSNDVVDTAQALQIRQACRIVLDELALLRDALKRRALEFQHTVQIGRTHGVHAEPITFGLKLAIWYEEAGRNLERLQQAAEGLRVGKISGAVGTFAHIGPEVEELICARLDLKPASVASQVIQRDRHAQLVSTLALVTALLEKIALEVRHLQRTEVREAEEYFARGQKGSSAMPHKRNPVTCEQICGLARVVRANVQAAFEDIALWHERDISHSSVERVILPDSTILADYLLDKTINLVDKMLVYPERMRRNLDMTRGLVFSGQLLLDLAAAGMLREQAYRIVQTHAMKAWEEEGDFRAAIESDPEIGKVLNAGQRAEAFSLDRQLRNVDKIFSRVFGSAAAN